MAIDIITTGESVSVAVIRAQPVYPIAMIVFALIITGILLFIFYGNIKDLYTSYSIKLKGEKK